MNMPQVKSEDARSAPKSAADPQSVLRQLLRDMATQFGLEGLPFPVAARNRGWLQTLDQICAMEPQLGAALEREKNQGPLGLVNVLASTFKPLLISTGSKPEQDCAGPSHLLAILKDYRDRNGALIEVTDALEQMLLASDLDEQLPIGMLALPYPSQYVAFGPAARAQLPMSSGDDNRAWVSHGCFCVQSPGKDGLGQIITIYVVLVTPDGRNMTLIFLNNTVNEPAMPLKDWVSVMATKRADVSQALREGLPLVSYLAKVFLYLGMKEARVHKSLDHSELEERLARVELKKRGKLQRRLTRLYDKIVVGPNQLPQDLAAAAGQAPAGVTPHWRRGHFRMQVHGPASKLRKLLFIRPTLVAAHQLTQSGALAPKSYSAR